MEVDWKDKQRQDGLIITSVIMTTIATIFVVLRCVSRFVLIRNPGPDDYLIIAALLLTIGYLIDIFILRNNHLGFPVTMLTLDNMINFIKATLAVQVMYYANIFCIKTSILFTYLRFAVTPTFRVLCYSTIALHAVFFFICFVVTLAQCKPLNKMWDLAGTVDGTCINTTAFFYFTSAFNIITDIWILALPLRTLHGINRPTRDKVALFLIFGVGTFAAVASVVRLHTIRTYTLATDPFREGILVNLWSVIEVTIAISCASVSALKPIFSGRQRRITRAAMSGDGVSGSGSGSGSTDLRYMRPGSLSRSKSQSSRFGGGGGGGYGSRWHMRLASKDKPMRTRTRSEGEAEMTQTGTGRSESGIFAPPQRPRLVVLPSGRRGEMEEEEAGVESPESLIAFSPFGDEQGSRVLPGEDGGVSSSGSILVLQK